MSYTGSSCEHIFKKYPEIYKSNPKEKSGYYRLNNNQWIYCNFTKIVIDAKHMLCCGGRNEKDEVKLLFLST